ncbi:hypothetical protein [Synechococcus sp. LTW-R]|nr:hypothetical protein [Synechococcus sp. LTW-R]QNG28504.1 hypothetical protein H0O22_01830 [Synechococcus sp. LTW-R]
MTTIGVLSPDVGADRAGREPMMPLVTATKAKTLEASKTEVHFFQK